MTETTTESPAQDAPEPYLGGRHEPFSPALAPTDSPEWNRYISLLGPLERRTAIKARRRGRTLTNPFPFWAHK